MGYFSADGAKLLASHSFTDPGGTRYSWLTAVDGGDTNGLTAVGTSAEGAKLTARRATVSRIKAGIRVWHYTEALEDVAAYKDNAAGAAVVQLADGGAIAAIGVGGPSPRPVFMLRLSATGKKQWRTQVSAADGLHLGAGLAVGEDTLWVGATQASQPAPFVVRLAKDGQVRLDRAVSTAMTLTSLAPRSDGTFSVVGHVYSAGGRSPVVGAIDGLGNLLSTSVVGGGGAADSELRAVSATGNSVWAVGARRASKNAASQALAIRVNEFGHADCQAADGCWGKRAIDCADGKACTVSACTGGTCKNPAISAGSQCETGSTCAAIGSCSAGACAAPKEGKFFQAEPFGGKPGQYRVRGFDLQSDGGFTLSVVGAEILVGGRFLDVGDKPRGTAWRLSSKGAFSAQWQTGGSTQWTGAIGLPDGTRLFAGANADGTPTAAHMKPAPSYIERHSNTSLGQWQVAHVAATAGAGALVVGTSTIAGVSKIGVLTASPVSGMHTVRLHGEPGAHWRAATRRAAVSMPDGGLVLLGDRLKGGAGKPLLLRVGPHGFVSCAAAAKCAHSGCDDGKACTANLCDPAKGCSHVSALCK